jgi:hypothetical protein
MSTAGAAAFRQFPLSILSWRKSPSHSSSYAGKFSRMIIIDGRVAATPQGSVCPNLFGL